MPPRFLMCSPEFYDIQYVINPWMEGHIHDTRRELARAQWSALREALAAHAEISVMPGRSGVPDLVFTANAAALFGKAAVLSSFRYPERQAEEPCFSDWLERDGFTITRLPRSIAFEGAGDALFGEDDRFLWFGHGVRSDIHAAPYLASALGVTIEPLTLLQSRFYHLDTCFCPLREGHLLYYPRAFDIRSNDAIESLVPAHKRLAVSEEDALHFACNAINVDDVVILNTASADLKAWLAERGMSVIETPTTEFLKAGGSTKCLSLRLE